ncbi:hypothetical protein MRX96_037560 [Rhipicephalus microplus]
MRLPWSPPEQAQPTEDPVSASPGQHCSQSLNRAKAQKRCALIGDIEDHGARPLQHFGWSLEGAKDPDALLGEVSQVDYSFEQAVLFAEITLEVFCSHQGYRRSCIHQ